MWNPTALESRCTAYAWRVNRFANSSYAADSCCWCVLQGVIPLGGCTVELVERGPKASKFGIRISHPDFVRGKFLVFAAENVDDQKAWEKALRDCSRV